MLSRNSYKKMERAYHRICEHDWPVVYLWTLVDVHWPSALRRFCAPRRVARSSWVYWVPSWCHIPFLAFWDSSEPRNTLRGDKRIHHMLKYESLTVFHDCGQSIPPAILFAQPCSFAHGHMSKNWLKRRPCSTHFGTVCSQYLCYCLTLCRLSSTITSGMAAEVSSGLFNNAKDTHSIVGIVLVSAQLIADILYWWPVQRLIVSQMFLINSVAFHDVSADTFHPRYGQHASICHQAFSFMVLAGIKTLLNGMALIEESYIEEKLPKDRAFSLQTAW